MVDIRARHCPICNQPVEWNQSYSTFPISLLTARHFVFAAIHDSCLLLATEQWVKTVSQ